MSIIDDATLLNTAFNPPHPSHKPYGTFISESKMAEAEILGEAKRAAARHSTAGISGWQPVPKPNKMFLTNTLLQTMASNRILSRKAGGKGEKALGHKRTERKLLQRKSKTDMDTNFVYMKPKKKKEKPIITTKTSKFKSNSTSSADKKSENIKEFKERCNVKKIKLKKG